MKGSGFHPEQKGHVAKINWSYDAIAALRGSDVIKLYTHTNSKVITSLNMTPSHKGV